MLIDTGPPGAIISALADVMPFADRTIDVLLLTHPDTDHIGGAPDILERYDVGIVVTTPTECAKELCAIIDDQIQQSGVATYQVTLGSIIDLGGGVVFDVLSPSLKGLEGNNDTSIIGRLGYGDTTMLFTGDASARIERYVASVWGTLLDVDVLKAGHHGSKTSTADELLKVTTPDIVFISAGRNNRYGHPHDDVVNRIKATDATVYGTYESGTVTLTSDGNRFEVKNKD